MLLGNVNVEEASESETVQVFRGLPRFPQGTFVNYGPLNEAFLRGSGGNPRRLG